MMMRLDIMDPVHGYAIIPVFTSENENFIYLFDGCHSLIFDLALIIFVLSIYF